MPKLRILFAGGGTAGHFYPLVAVAEELGALTAKNNWELEMRYMGAAGSYAQELIRHHIRVVALLSSKLRRYLAIQNLVDIPKFFISFFQALWKMYWYMPDVLFSKGGPGSLPVVLAARWYGIPIFIHESDAVPGLSNRIAARYAKRIAIAFTSAERYFPGKNVALVGNPVRRFLFSEYNPQDVAKRALGFNPALPLLLVWGGSQGAVALNDFILDNLEPLIRDYQVLHQVGERNYEQVTKELVFLLKEFVPEEKARYRAVAFLEKEVKDALAAADLVIGRAGSGTIFELAAAGKPAILVPLPDAANGHQRENAYEFAGKGGAIVIEQENLLTNIFLTQLKKLFSEKETLATMAASAKQFAKPEAAAKIAEEVVNVWKAYSFN